VGKIAVLSVAAFVSSATMRVADPLLPQISDAFEVSTGTAANIVTWFAVAYGVAQVTYGRLGDRVGKLRVIGAAGLFAGLATLACGFADDLAWLELARAAAGATAAAVIPLSMAWIGDRVPYHRRQPVLARYLIGTILGLIAGQILGGVVGGLFGWRAVFLTLGAAWLTVATVVLVAARGDRPSAPGGPGSFATYLALLARPRVRLVLATVAIEGLLFYGAVAYVGAYLHECHGMGFAEVGFALAAQGIGGLAFAIGAGRLLARLGEPGLVLGGGALAASALMAMSVLPSGWAAVPMNAVLGLGLVMLHNTLQTNATQMAPEARGAAVALFAAMLFAGQSIGVFVGGLIVDAGEWRLLFLASGAGLIILALAFRRLRYAAEGSST
jgi:predicted MFS family arabinose efflux permease